MHSLVLLLWVRNITEVIVEDILLRAPHVQTSFPFPVLITQLCEDAGVPFNGEIDVQITPAT